MKQKLAVPVKDPSTIRSGDLLRIEYKNVWGTLQHVAIATSIVYNGVNTIFYHGGVTILNHGLKGFTFNGNNVLVVENYGTTLQQSPTLEGI